MARGKRKTTAIDIVGAVLAAIGKPFYFILSNLLIGILFILYFVGHSITSLPTLLSKTRSLFFSSFRKTKVDKKKKIIFQRFSLRKFNFPKLHFPKIILHKIELPKINKPQLNLPKASFSKFKIPQVKIRKRFLLPIIFLTIFGYLTYFYILKDLPSPNELLTRDQEVSTKIYDRNGELLYTIYKDQNRTPVSLNQIPNIVRLATLAAEDAEFYQHPGFSVRGIIRSIEKNIRTGKLSGGSTITQQLVKNALLSSEKTIVRKLRELVLSLGVEKNFTKDQILEMYLNEVSYGGTAYGIQEASRHYLGKNVWDLTLAEAALIAGLPQSPTHYSPFGSNPDLTFSRQREILHLMKVNKFITQEEEDKALTERITFAPNNSPIKAPHFVMYVREKLIEEFGEEVVLKGGLTVITTLDYEIQKMTEKVVSDEVNKLKNLRVGNGAAIVTNPQNGEILAMVGSKDYFDIANGGNVNVVTRPRQPGSSIKVVNYAMALSNGLTLASTIDDTPISFNIQGLPPYSPKNYDGTYKGKISIRSALAQSRNIPAVKILSTYGVNSMIDLGEKMGITTWGDRNRFGLSLTLGGGETKLIDMAKVYGVIANKGVKNELKSISEVRNYKGRIINTRFNSTTNQQVQVLDPRVAFLLIDVLKDNIARSPAFGMNSMLVVPDHPEVAVKTGTSNDLKDNLTIGFNKDYLIAVWVGNNDSSPMSRIASGITGAAPIWNKIMRSLLSNSESIQWEVPSKLVQKECFGKMEWFLEEKQLSCPKVIEPAASIINSQVSVD